MIRDVREGLSHLIGTVEAVCGKMPTTARACAPPRAFSATVRKVLSPQPVTSPLPPLDPEVAAHIGDSYPHNLDYRVKRGKLKPRRKLRTRFRRIKACYAEPLDELLDLSSCKGFFVLEAAAREENQRALGIDIHEPDLDASRAVAAHLGLERARFEQLTLEQLARDIDEYGGPFGTVLLVNTYQYMFYGSPRSDVHIPDHRQLFALLAKVTRGRLVFSNRVRFDALPRNVQARARKLGLEAAYNPEDLRAAAEDFFELEERKPLGKIPLWILHARG